MKENKEVKISYIAAHLTTIISVTLVLVLVGVISMVWIGAGRETQKLRERIELSVVMADSISNERAQEIAQQIEKEPYSLTVTCVSKEVALKNWTKDTGEDLEALFGVNPLSPEVNFTLNAAYSTEQQITSIKKKLSKLSGVSEVAAPDTRLVESINRNISGLTALLGGIAIVMIVISFVLINNTVHLTIYSRRFTIHTMQLVGATNGYIRRPVILNNLLCGFISGILATGLLSLVPVLAPYAGFDNVTNYLSWIDFAIVAGVVTAVGMVLCSFAAWIASAKYLRKDYDELFR